MDFDDEIDDNDPRVLVLTAWYFPYQIIHWHVAVANIYKGTHNRVVDYNDEICSPSVTWKRPAVISIKRSLGKSKKGVKFSRFNIYTRDNFTCQYCNHRFKMKNLTFDHVIPRCEGGKTDWTNIVTACKPCNSIKGRKMCDQAGMFPRNLPYRPKSLPMVSPIGMVKNAPDEWVPYLTAAMMI